MAQTGYQAPEDESFNEQARLLRECRAAIDSLINQKKGIESLVCGSTTLGNLRAKLGAYRPQGVFSGT